MAYEKREKSEFTDRVIEICRISRTVRGGRRLRFRALVISGDLISRVGMGVAKASEVSTAISKATTAAHKAMITIPITKQASLAYLIRSSYGSAQVLLKPARAGTSIIAGGTIRTIAELSGIKNIVAKSFGSSNKINTAKATMLGLKSLKVIDDKLEKNDVQKK